VTLTTRKMSSRHESDICDLLGGRVTKNSGATWAETMDVLMPEGDYYSFALDGKSTLSKSCSVGLAMWRKAVKQSGIRLTALPLRFYRDESLVQVEADLVVLSLKDFADLVHDANELQAIRAQGCLVGSHDYRHIAGGTGGSINSYQCEVCLTGREVKDA
jgi:hypothetical protein